MIDLIKNESLEKLLAERAIENNKADKVAEIFGKKLHEKFYVRLVGMEIVGPLEVQFTESGLEYEAKHEISGPLLNLLISGLAEIVEDENAV